MLRQSGLGLGTLALSLLLAEQQELHADDEGRIDPASLKGHAKSVILLFMGGGPSQVDTFDPKPELTKLDGKDVPDSIAKGIPRIARAPLVGLAASPYKFKKYGKSGIEVSELFPEVARHVDDLCILRSCKHDSPIHAPAEYLATTGTQTGDRPSLGSWIHYGLGSTNKNLPGYIVFITPSGGGRATAWSNGFLPASHQGTVTPLTGIPNLELPKELTSASRKAQLDLLNQLNHQRLKEFDDTSELETRIASFELAARMQASAPEAFDLTRETSATKKLYGIDEKETEEVGKYCLLARRLVERGVRFVQLRMGQWDAHADLPKNHGTNAKASDKPIAALLADLKRTGLLKQTLVIWGGEFGRTPTAENRSTVLGRNHSPSGYTMWLAGGGVKGGQFIGKTDDVGYAAIERAIHPNDLHATILAAFGIEQRKLYYRHNNRKEILTVNGGEVIKDVLA